ncbi:AraC family transcriptional regulator [Aerococcus sp. 1KP-2016]|uniref:helix-turn-helix transcriptional regulator n=1 Tax=Aerococcus sp. 1KP-2016 TaxID=1981982 RepID=UPI000B997103|nr:AraC family transcriptional regulator [Aerococcus sp. 1KP-2016]OYQ66348.1 AraC family transcriptional regulator [Aerococcus sp. 1KP-2016]
MTIGTPPFRIKLTKVDQEMVEHYNRSSFHRNELLIPVRPFTLALGDKKIEVSSRQIIILPEPISRKILLPIEDFDEKDDSGHSGHHEKLYAYILALGSPYLEAVTTEFIETPELKKIFDEPHALSFSFVTWQHMFQSLLQLKEELKRPEDPMQKKMVFNIVSTILIELFRMFHSPTENQLQLSEREILAYEIKQYIQETYRKNITLQDIADHFNISTSTVNRVFQPYFHSTIYQFILDLRLTYARSLIENGLTITESWQQAGFNDYSNFYRAFIKHYHIRPHEVSKKRPDKDNH